MASSLAMIVANATSASITPPLHSLSKRDQTIQDIVLPTLKELSLSLALAVAYTFFATPGGAAILFLGVAIQTITTLSLRILLSRNDLPKCFHWLKSAFFSVGSMYNGMTLIHETGHVAALKLLLKNPKPTITLSPYASGLTSFAVTKPTPLGLSIGKENIMPIVSAAGPVLTLAISSIGFATGLSLQESSPETSRVLIVAALVDFIRHAIYALTALIANPTKFSHDFISLWAAGLHPVAAAITIVAIPILIYSVFHIS